MKIGARKRFLLAPREQEYLHALIRSLNTIYYILTLHHFPSFQALASNTAALTSLVDAYYDKTKMIGK